MWSLHSIQGNVEHRLVCNKDIVIGRKDADIVLTGDSSVSRKHAVINVTQHAKDIKTPAIVPTVTITDSSKFGTFYTHHGLEKAKVERKAQLADGDTVQFGAQHSVFKLEYTPLVLTTSMLEGDTKARLQAAMLKLGGHIVNSWNDQVTHVVVNEIKLSIKVTQALAKCSHIVKPDFVFKFSESVISGTPPPNPEQYLPDLAEPNLSKEDCCFKVNASRKDVFRGRVFVYLCKKQLKRLGTTVTYAGGRNVLVNDGSVGNDVFLQETTSVIFCVPTEEERLISNARYEEIQTLLLGNDRRFIQEHEIGLAVLYCDASVYGNSNYELNTQNIFTQPSLTKAPAPQSITEGISPEIEKGRASKRLREEDVPGTSRDNCIEDSLPNGAKELDNDPSPKRFKATEQPNRPSLMADTYNCDTVGTDNDKVETVDDIPNSCLDDDNLWSQNFESSSFSVGHVTKLQPVVKKPDQIKPRQKTPVKPPAIKVEREPLRISSAFPVMSSTSSRQVQPSKAVIETKETGLQQQAEHNDHTNHSEAKSIAAEDRTSVTATDKQKALSDNGYDPAYPLHVSTVTVTTLVVKRSKNIEVETQQTGVKNFKRFKKVWPTYMTIKGDSESDSCYSHRIPRIIGGKDFFVNKERDNVSDIGDWFPSRKFGLSQDAEDNPFIRGF